MAKETTRVDLRRPLGKHSRLVAIGLPALVGQTSLLLDLDTGASISIVDHSVFLRLAEKGCAPPLSACTRRFHTVNGAKLPVYGKTELTFSLGGANFCHEFVVTNMPCWSGLLGLDFLRQFLKMTVEFQAGRVKLDELTIDGVFVEDQGVRPVCVRKHTVVYPGRERLIDVEQKHLGSFKKLDQPRGAFMLVEPLECYRGEQGCLAASVVTYVHGGKVSLINLGTKAVVLSRGTLIGFSTPITEHEKFGFTEEGVDLSCVNSVYGCKAGSAASKLMGEKQTPAHLRELLERTTADMTTKESKLVRKLIVDYADVFAEPDGPLGRTTLVHHEIDTGDAAPVRERMRRYSPKHLEIIDQEVDRMLEQDVIEPSDSPWNSGIVIVKKKDGSARMCLDVRRLNKITKKDAYPLPLISHNLSSLNDTRRYCTLDLQAGYWQLPLAESAKEKTAFSVPRRGHFQFKVMPFGLCNAPASFERFMERVLRGLQWESCLVYLDDIIVAGGTLEETVAHMVKLLDRLRSAGLKLKPSKCTLFAKEVSFLGHLVSEKGVACDPSKVEAVKEWPQPQNLHEVRSFLGLAGYYREYIDAFSEIAEPMFNLTRKEVPFDWTEDCEEAFMILKDKLTSAPILAYPDQTKTYILDTDCSQFGMGAVLSQVHEGRERVVAYASKTLSKSQRNYCTTMRELLAVVTFVKHFKHFLYGPSFVVRTDHASLVWLRNFKHPEGMLARWITSLEAYDYQIVHRKGRDHANADSLSRRTTRPCLRGDCEDCMHFPVRKGGKRVKRSPKKVASETPPLGQEGGTATSVGSDKAADLSCGVNAVLPFPTMTWEEMAKAQEEDVEIEPVLKWRRESEQRPPSRELEGYGPGVRTLWGQWGLLEVCQGVLCRKFAPRGDRVIKQVVLPRSLRVRIMRELHDSPLGGHRGIRKTFASLQRRVYWPGQRSDTQRWCRTCLICQQTKASNTRRRFPLQQRLPGFPLERVAMDVIGPIRPPSKNGNSYILVVEDYFSKFVEAYPLSDHTAQSVADVFVTEWVARYGSCLELHTDQGPEFESQLFKRVLDLLGVKKTRTAPYRPQSDGLVERVNRSLKSLLMAYVGQDYENWDEYLPYVMIAYRSSVHDSTGCTPNLLFLNRECNLPVDFLVRPPEGVDVPSCPVEYVEWMRETALYSAELVRTHQKKALVTQKRNYDAKACVRTFEVGDLVWREYKPQAAKHKFAPVWKGPYVVEERVGDVNYRIRLSEGGNSLVVHVDHLKKFEMAEADEFPEERYPPLSSSESVTSEVEGDHTVDEVDTDVSAEPAEASGDAAEESSVDDTEVIDEPVVVAGDRATPPVRTRTGRVIRPPVRMDL